MTDIFDNEKKSEIQESSLQYKEDKNKFYDIKQYDLLKVFKLYVSSLYDDATKTLLSFLTSVQKTDLTDGGDSTLHYHSSDRNSANFAGTNWTDLTDAGATILHKHDHGGQDGLTDDDHTQYQRTDGTRAYTGTGNGFKDEDNMASNSATATASQQSIKAYVDTAVAGVTVPGVTWKFGTSSRGGGEDSSTETIAHGLGRTPRFVRITGNGKRSTNGIKVVSFGVYDGTNTRSIYSYENSSTGVETYTSSTTYVIWFGKLPTEDSQRATISVDGTNITLNWTKTGSPDSSGTMNFIWEVF